MRKELVVPRDRRLTLTADDELQCVQSAFYSKTYQVSKDVRQYLAYRKLRWLQRQITKSMVVSGVTV